MLRHSIDMDLNTMRECMIIQGKYFHTDGLRCMLGHRRLRIRGTYHSRYYRRHMYGRDAGPHGRPRRDRFTVRASDASPISRHRSLRAEPVARHLCETGRRRRRTKDSVARPPPGAPERPSAIFVVHAGLKSELRTGFAPGCASTRRSDGA
ncbi:hypothetical protein GY45DRAFT_632416 [Cubamyces sp. BRFM 1775]|nr:hypothetical protein GY45DRAFT_632416 [Cubamyces sp. BRFM 1775]